MRVLVTGAAGQLGSAIVREFGRDHDVVPLTIADLDLTRHGDAMAAVAAVRPGVIVNCAAYNDVDGAEDDPVTALAVNGFAVRSLAEAARQAGAALVHYSTDFVFDGTADRPYTEEDRPEPRSFYAISKLVGDWFAGEAGRHYILRVESLFGGASTATPLRRSSVDRIVEAIQEGREARVFTDRTVTPSFVADVAVATRLLVERAAPFGLYHCVNSGVTTWLELAEAIGALLNVTTRLLAVPFAEAALKARRPKYCALSNAKLAAAGIAMPSWRDALARYVAALEEPNRRATNLR
jgi:dTDP-4-dehydrorhamnose reductase